MPNRTYMYEEMNDLCTEAAKELRIGSIVFIVGAK